MKKYLFIFTLLISNVLIAQSVYKSQSGFSVNFDKTWERVPTEVLRQRVKDLKDFLEYRKDVQYDACYQKTGNTEMDHPNILFQGIYATNHSDAEIKRLLNVFGNKPTIDKIAQEMVNGKFDIEIKTGHNYYDKINNILFFAFDMGVSIKGNIVCMTAINFGKNASIMTYCYSYKDEFKYDQKEFLDIIYSIKENVLISEKYKFTNKQGDAVALNHYNQADIQSKNGNSAEAIKLYKNALEKYPDVDDKRKSEAYNNMGNAKMRIQNFKGAISDFNKAIEINPKLDKTYYNRGVARYGLGDFRGAIFDYNGALQINPNLAVAYFNRALTKFNISDFKGSINDYSKYLEINPNLPEAYINRGNSKFSVDDYQGAISDYSKALKINPSLAMAYFNRGLAKIQLGEKNSGCSDLNKSLELGNREAYKIINQYCK